MTAVTGSSKETWQLVRFTNKRTGVVLATYTDSDSNQVHAGQLYYSTPELEIKLAKNSGMIGKQPCNFILPIADVMTRRITDGILTNYRIMVDVIEIVKAQGADSATPTTFTGEVIGAGKNFSGRRDTLALSALSPKAMLERILVGLPCNHQCGNALGDRYCKVNMSLGERTKSAQINVIDGKKITVSSASVASGLVDRFYAKGYMDFDGITVLVHDWRNEVEGDKLDFFMQERVPDEWLGEVVTLYAGCDKTVETCRSRYNQESEFNGRGYATPAYHPLFEDGKDRQ